MAEKIEIELDDTGNVGKLPDVLQRAFDSKVTAAITKAEENWKSKHGIDPSERERLKAIEDENSRLKEAEARAQKNYEEADRIKNERHENALKEKDAAVTAKDQEIARRDVRLRSMLGAEVRAAATAAGARDESLPELVTLIGHTLDLDPETLEPFVKGADGKPLEKDGKRVSIDAHVQQYLADHPHHFNATRGKPGRATGGATMRGATVPGDKDAVLAAAAENPNATNVNAAIRSIRSKAS